MATLIAIRPRGDPSPGASWADSRWRVVWVEVEDEDSWTGHPVANAACPQLVYPKDAWEKRTDHCGMCGAEWACAPCAGNATFPEGVMTHPYTGVL